MAARSADWLVGVGAAVVALALATSTRADAPTPSADDAATAPQAPDHWWAVHVQATDVLQYHPSFHSAFEGPNSLKSHEETSNTVNASLFLGARPWKGGQFWFDLDLNQ